MKVNGTIGYEFRVSKVGTVTQCAVKKSSGQIWLDNAVCAAVQRMRFQPARERGAPVDVSLTGEMTLKVKQIVTLRP